MNGKLASRDRRHHIGAQHQVIDVGGRDQHRLVPVEPARAADVKKALDLLVDGTNRLHLAELVDRAGHRQALGNGRLRQVGQQRAQLSQRRAVALNQTIRLLKHQAHRQCQWLVAGVAFGQEAGQDQHPLGVDRARQLDLALDVEQLALAQPAGGGDAGGLGKGEITQVQHRQAVDLPHHRALRGDHQRAAQHRLLQPVAQPVMAPDAGVDRLLHIGRTQGAAASLPAPVVGLAQQVGHAAHVGGQALAVAGQASAVVDHPAHRTAVQRQQLVAAGQRGQQARIQQVVLRVALDAVFKVRRHLEQLAKLGVVVLQQVVQKAVTKQNDLDVQRYRLRLQRHGADQAHQLAHGLDANLARLQRSLQTVPGKRLHQHLACVQQQVAAIGAVQGAGLDQGEIRHQCTELRHMLNTPDQIAVGGVVLGHDRGAGGLAVADQHIDLVAVKALPRHQLEAGEAGTVFGFAEIVGVVDHVLLHHL